MRLVAKLVEKGRARWAAHGVKLIGESDMNGRTIGNLILMTLICVVIFVVFMAMRPAPAGETPIYGPDGKYQGSVFNYGKTQTYTDRKVGDQERERHDVVLRPQRQLHRIGRVVDRPGVQLQQEVTMSAGEVIE